MNTVRVIYQLFLADFRERTRRYSFLITLIAFLFMCYLVLTEQYALTFDHYRGELNSAWAGSFVAIYAAFMIGLIGFYLVKNTISRDRQTGVGEILAATSINKFTYIIGKALSNISILMIMLFFMIATATIMQMFSGVEGGFDPVVLVLPFVYIAFPVVIFAAAMALFFESVRWLRGVWGNIIYLYTAEMLFLLFLITGSPLIDLGYLHPVMGEMEKAAMEYAGVDKIGTEMGFTQNAIIKMGPKNIERFTWKGINWTPAMFVPRLAWIGISVLLILLAMAFFDRFDSSKAKQKLRKMRRSKKKAAIESDVIAGVRKSAISVAQLTKVKLGFNLFRSINAELRLMLKGHNWIWYIIAAGLIAVQCTVPFVYVQLYALPFSLIWPIAMWSSMGTRDRRFNTNQLLLSTPNPMRRQTVYSWFAGIVIALVMASGTIVRSLLYGEFQYALVLLANAVFISTLALLLGTISGSRKLFEIVYLVLWYIGPLNQLKYLDFLGATTDSIAMGVPFIFSALILATIPSIPFFWKLRQRLEN